MHSHRTASKSIDWLTNISRYISHPLTWARVAMINCLCATSLLTLSYLFWLLHKLPQLSNQAHPKSLPWTISYLNLLFLKYTAFIRVIRGSVYIHLIPIKFDKYTNYKFSNLYPVLYIGISPDPIVSRNSTLDHILSQDTRREFHNLYLIRHSLYIDPRHPNRIR